MSFDETIFERETLYAQVWAEPLRTVATRFQLSDSGLRKICKRLGVPMPPLGYWAKLAAGKRVRATTLPPDFEGATSYVRRVYVDEAAPERERRIAALLHETAPALSLRLETMPSSPETFHPVVRRTGKRMARRKGDDRRLLHASGGDVLEAAVSEPLKERALRILDLTLKALLSAGGEIKPRAGDGKQLRIHVLCEPVGVKIEEAFNREERRLTPAEVAERAKSTYFYFRDRWVYTPTGKLKLTLLSDNQYSPFATLSDGSTSRIEDRVDSIASILLAKVAERQVKRSMDEEDRLRREAAWARRQERLRVRDSQLGRLEQFEKEIAKWRRAEDLRAFAKALVATNTGTKGRAEHSAWILNAADWLDPLVDKSWPDVDVEG